jgi:prepilin-type N-terminal cleavage/methylation domain-containing protein
MRKHHGFTLIEVVIGLVIVGLLLGGVLKGQELITGARVRNLISQQDSLKAGVLGFLDRYRAYPGDYNQARANIPNCGACAEGNNNGQIRSIAAGDAIDEYIAAWEHLSRAGFVGVTYTYAVSPEVESSAPANIYARYLRLVYDNSYGNGLASMRHNLKTGNQIPSDVLAEVDRKIDDGVATSGTFQYSAYDGGGMGGAAPVGSGACYAAGALNNWVADRSVANCGAAVLF